MTFTAKQLSTLCNALYVANDRFREDIKEIAASDLPEHAKARLTECFEGQIKEGQALLEVLE